ncbi:MAG: phage holin family protein [Pseudomonadota bacterium]
MMALSSGLLRAGLALKLNQIKRATRSYLRDRANQATGTAASYAVAAGLFGAAGIFLIAAVLVGITALFRWIEINYGLFWAFGAIGGLLVAFAAICAGVAVSRLKRPTPQFPSLASRLRVAINANPIKPARVEAATDTAAAILREPATPVSSASHVRRTSRPGPVVDSRKMQAGMVVAATLLGWAAVRRQQVRRTAP